MTKLYLDIDEIKERPNDMTLGSYVRKKSFDMEKSMNKFKVNVDPNDKVAQIMSEWYQELARYGCQVQPKASTILGTILAKHLSSETRDIWAEALTVKGGEFASWYASLTNDEKLQYEEGRKKASLEHDPRELLKG